MEMDREVMEEVTSVWKMKGWSYKLLFDFINMRSDTIRITQGAGNTVIYGVDWYDTSGFWLSQYDTDQLHTLDVSITLEVLIAHGYHIYDDDDVSFVVLDDDLSLFVISHKRKSCLCVPLPHTLHDLIAREVVPDVFATAEVLIDPTTLSKDVGDLLDVSSYVRMVTHRDVVTFYPVDMRGCRLGCRSVNVLEQIIRLDCDTGASFSVEMLRDFGIMAKRSLKPVRVLYAPDRPLLAQARLDEVNISYLIAPFIESGNSIYWCDE